MKIQRQWLVREASQAREQIEARAQNKAATFVGRGSVEIGGFSGLSIQRCTQARLTRSLPVVAGIGKVAGLERARFHPVDETTPDGKWVASD
jgi:hypothetical protein